MYECTLHSLKTLERERENLNEIQPKKVLTNSIM